MKKYLDIDMEVEKTLTALCDGALKNGGMQMLAVVNQLISSIKQREDE